MNARTLVSTLPTLLAGVLFAAHAAGDTFVVDDDGGPGVDFVDIPPAVLFASPGDVLLVRSGTYSAFVLDKGLTIVGAAGASVATGVRVTGIPASQKATLADLDLRDLRVDACDGLVLLHSLDWNTGFGGGTTLSHYLVVDDCTDVRLHEATILGFAAKTPITSSNSRLELVQCELRGGSGSDSDCGEAQDGAPGATFFGGGGRVHASLTSALGGEGGWQLATCISFCGGLGGRGGDGFELHSGDLIVSGRASDVIQGGGGGCGREFSCDGFSGDGLVLFGGDARVSGASFVGGVHPCGTLGGSSISNQGGTLEFPAPLDPSLELLGTPAPGGSVSFVIHGVPGANVRLFLGRNAALETNPGIVLERLSTRERGLALGSMPGTGFVSQAQPIPAFLPEGFTFWAQGELVLMDGTVQRTNSVAVILR